MSIRTVVDKYLINKHGIGQARMVPFSIRNLGKQ